MTTRHVHHEVKLETSVKIILGVLAIGVCLNAVAPAFSLKEVLAEQIKMPEGPFQVHISGNIGVNVPSKN